MDGSSASCRVALSPRLDRERRRRYRGALRHGGHARHSIAAVLVFVLSLRRHWRLGVVAVLGVVVTVGDVPLAVEKRS